MSLWPTYASALISTERRWLRRSLWAQNVNGNNPKSSLATDEGFLGWTRTSNCVWTVGGNMVVPYAEQMVNASNHRVNPSEFSPPPKTLPPLLPVQSSVTEGLLYPFLRLAENQEVRAAEETDNMAAVPTVSLTAGHCAPNIVPAVATHAAPALSLYKQLFI